MARVLVLYGTSDGQTRKIAIAIAERLHCEGVVVDTVDAGAADPDPSEYSGCVVAASVHAGHYQKAVARWARAHAAALNSRPAAFVSVSLSTLQSTNDKAAADLAAIVNRFCSACGWHPARVKHVAGALKYTRYNVFIRWIMKRIAAGAGGDTDTSRDYEYTDWTDVRDFADEFRQDLSVAA